MGNDVCTVTKLFSMILEKTQENVNFQDLEISYELPGKRYVGTQIMNVEFDVSFVVKRELNGIYCDLYLIGNIGRGTYVNIPFGWFKNNSTDDESFKMMSSLGSDFVIATDYVISSNMDYLNRTGYKIDVYNGNEKIYGFFCVDREDIPESCRVKIKGKSITKAILTDNMTKQTKEFQIALFTEE